MFNSPNLTSGQISRLAISLHLFLSNPNSHPDGPSSTRRFLHPILQVLSLCTINFEVHDAETQAACLWLFCNVARYSSLSEQTKLYEESGLEDRFPKLYTVYLEKIVDITLLQDIHVQALRIWLEECPDISSRKSTRALRILGICSSRMRKPGPRSSITFLLNQFPEHRIADHTLAWLLILVNCESTSNTFEILSSFAKLLVTFADHSIIARRLLSGDVVETLYSGLSKFYSTKRDELSYGILLAYLYSFREFLPLSLSHCKNVLRNGLLSKFTERYLQAASHKPQANRSFLQLYVSQISMLFQPFLIFGSSIRKILQAIDSLPPVDRRALARDECMGMTWQKFELLVVERAVAFRLFTAHRLKGAFKCSNVSICFDMETQFLTIHTAELRMAEYSEVFNAMLEMRRSGLLQ